MKVSVRFLRRHLKRYPKHGDKHRNNRQHYSKTFYFLWNVAFSTIKGSNHKMIVELWILQSACSDKACTGQNAQSIVNISAQISSSGNSLTIFMTSSDTVMMRWISSSGYFGLCMVWDRPVVDDIASLVGGYSLPFHYPVQCRFSVDIYQFFV